MLFWSLFPFLETCIYILLLSSLNKGGIYLSFENTNALFLLKSKFYFSKKLRSFAYLIRNFKYMFHFLELIHSSHMLVLLNSWTRDYPLVWGNYSWKYQLIPIGCLWRMYILLDKDHIHSASFTHSGKLNIFSNIQNFNWLILIKTMYISREIK